MRTKDGIELQGTKRLLAVASNLKVFIWNRDTTELLYCFSPTATDSTCLPCKVHLSLESGRIFFDAGNEIELIEFDKNYPARRKKHEKAAPEEDERSARDPPKENNGKRKRASCPTPAASKHIGEKEKEKQPKKKKGYC